MRCGHPGQNKPSALEKVERLEKLERIGGPKLQMQALQISELDRLWFLCWSITIYEVM